MYDVAIIGAGVIGGMIARTLSKYNLNICILEKENDVAMGATKANSAIVHAGFDAAEGSLKAKLNVKGSQMMENICKELGVKYKNNGSLVIGFNDEDRKVLNSLLQRGIDNGVKDLRIIEKTELKEIEPNLSENVVCALYAPTGAIVCPYELTVAAIGNAMDNGAELKRNFKVTKLIEKNESYEIYNQDNFVVNAKYVINCAGVYSDEIASLAGDNSFNITARRGEYILYDKECGNYISHTVFRTPSKMGKGILVSPTVDGNLLLGPTSVDIDDKENKATTQQGFADILNTAKENIACVPVAKTITSFCGLRAVGSTGDFIINSPRNHFINVAGIESPGLSASPAIAEYVENMLKEQNLSLNKKSSFNPIRAPKHAFREASIEEKNKIIKNNPSYGRIICRCEGVSEGEILDAIRSNPKPCDLDGVKRRTRAQMGRCQGGFCSPYITELLAKELEIPYEKVTKFGGKSLINIKKTKGGAIMKDLVIIGGGPAGMSAAIAAYESGIKDILILERDEHLGGILQQCIHNGFGLHKFGKELTGPEYAWEYEKKVLEYGIEFKLNTMVLDITDEKTITATNAEDGLFQLQAKSIILAMGCRERSKGALNIAGSRPAGIYSAGTAQKYVNMKGYLPGENIVILGSGDIGLIMARRMTLEGAKVHAVCELMPYSGGLARNIEQCLNDFDIPLKLNHTVVEIHGKERVEGVTIAMVDENRKPIAETKEFIPCDTLLLSVGLIPENELSKKADIDISNITNGAIVNQDRQTSIEGIFACGNVLHVHDLVDFVSDEAEIAGKAAAKYINKETAKTTNINITTDKIIRYTVPQIITEEKDVTVYFRVSDIYKNVKINVSADGNVLLSKKRPKVAPGEMEAITLKAETLKGVKNLHFSVEEV